MATVTDASKVTSDLNDLIQLDYDAIAAYEAAIERLEQRGLQAAVNGISGGSSAAY